MADYLVTDTELTSVANAIRTKGGTSANLSFPTGFVNAINAIPTGSNDIKAGIFHNPSTTSQKVAIVTVSDLGFTPRYFVLMAIDIDDATTSTAFLVGSFFPMTSSTKVKARYTRTSSGLNESRSQGTTLAYDTANNIRLDNNRIWFNGNGGTSVYLFSGDYAWMAVK